MAHGCGGDRSAGGSWSMPLTRWRSRERLRRARVAESERDSCAHSGDESFAPKLAHRQADGLARRPHRAREELVCEWKRDADAIGSDTAVGARQLQQLQANAFSEGIDRGEAKAFLAVVDDCAQALDQARSDAFDRCELCERAPIEDTDSSAAEADERLTSDRRNEHVTATSKAEDRAPPSGVGPSEEHGP